MHVVLHFSLFAANLNFQFPKIVQQHRQVVVGDIKYSCSKFRKLSSNKNFKIRLKFDNVTQSFKVGTFLRHSIYIYCCWNILG